MLRERELHKHEKKKQEEKMKKSTQKKPARKLERTQKKKKKKKKKKTGFSLMASLRFPAGALRSPASPAHTPRLARASPLARTENDMGGKKYVHLGPSRVLYFVFL
jgi:hypothetical protein